MIFYFFECDETATRPYSIKEEDELALALRSFRVDWRSVRETFGSRTVDVRLCDGIWWKNIPESVWNFEIGGFQVLRKWLSYRGVNVCGRNLSVEDCAVFSDMARRLAILVLMGLALDYSWQDWWPRPENKSEHRENAPFLAIFPALERYASLSLYYNAILLFFLPGFIHDGINNRIS